MNFETAYLTALDGLIVAMGGTVPTVATLNFRMAELARLEAIVAAADATLPLTGINYQDAILSHWAAAIAALGGAVPPPQLNYRQAVLLHVQALQAARGVTVQVAGNFQDAMLGLLPSVDTPSFDSAALAIMTAVETADGQALETTVRNAINAFVVGCKTDGIWTPLSSGGFRLLIGPRTLAGIFKCGIGADPTNFGFVSGDYIRATGLKNSGGKNLTVDIPVSALQTSNHFSLYSTEMIYDSNGRYYISNASTIIAGTQGCRMRANEQTLRSHGTGTPSSAFIGFSRSQSANYDWAFSTQFGNQISTSIAETADSFTLYTNLGTAELLTRLSWYSSGSSLGVNGLSLLESRLSTYMSAIAGI